MLPSAPETQTTHCVSICWVTVCILLQLHEYHYHWKVIFSTDKQAIKCARERSNTFSHLGQKCMKEQLLIKKLIKVCMIRTYKSFSCLIPHKEKKSHFKLGAEVYADITQIKKASGMLLSSPDLDTSSLKWSTFSAERELPMLSSASFPWCKG